MILDRDHPIVCRNRVGASIARPGVTTWQGRPAMAQEQLREVHELVVEQKQQRSLRASDVFCLLLFMRFAGGALDGDEERRTPGVRDARECAW